MKKLLFLITLAFFTFGTYSPSAFCETKISELTGLVTGQPDPQDFTIFVDDSDEAMGPSGTNKKIPVFRMSDLSGISPYTISSYQGGVTLYSEHFGESFAFTGTTRYDVWFPDMNSSVSGQSIEFLKSGPCEVYIHSAGTTQFVGNGHKLILSSQSGASSIALLRLRVGPSGETAYIVDSYNVENIIKSFTIDWTSGVSFPFLASITEDLQSAIDRMPAVQPLEYMSSSYSSVTAYPTANGEIEFVSGSGASITPSGSSVYMSSKHTITYAWQTTGAGLSNVAGVWSPPIRLPWASTIDRVTITSDQSGADSGVSIGVLYNSTTKPTSGETIFNAGDIGKPGGQSIYSKDWSSGGTNLASGGYVVFVPHSCGTGVTNAAIEVDVWSIE